MKKILSTNEALYFAWLDLKRKGELERIKQLTEHEEVKKAQKEYNYTDKEIEDKAFDFWFWLIEKGI